MLRSLDVARAEIDRQIDTDIQGRMAAGGVQLDDFELRSFQGDPLRHELYCQGRLLRRYRIRLATRSTDR